MADQQNPPQDDTQTTPVAQTPTAAVTDDLPGEISLSTSTESEPVPSEGTEDDISAIEQISLENTENTISENSIAELPVEELPSMPAEEISEVPTATIEPISLESTENDISENSIAELPVQELPNTPAEEISETPSSAPVNDPLSIDLGDISMDPVIAPQPEEVTPASASVSDTAPTFDLPDLSIAEETISADNNTQQEPLSLQEDLQEVPMTTTNESTSNEMPIIDSIEMPEITNISNSSENIDQKVEGSIEELPVTSDEGNKENAIETKDTTTQIIDTPLTNNDPLPEPVSTEKNTLLNNLVATEKDTITDSNNTMTLDLDSLTSDIAPQANSNAIAAALNTPVSASVILPEQTNEQHGSTKKKTFAMMILLLMLLGIGGFVFKTMMPNESDKLIASVMGIIGQISGTATAPAVITPVVVRPQQTPEETVSMDTGNNKTISTGNSASGSTTGIVYPELPANSGTQMNNTGMSTDSGMITEQPTENTGTTNTTPEDTTPRMTKDEAHSALLILAQQSRKSLSVSLRRHLTNTTPILYKTFKDTTNLLKALANTSDISTIPDVDAQIKTLQQSLSQANIILNVPGNNNTES